MSGRPLPLQCALFASAASEPSLLAEARNADVVYLDGIRTLLLMRRLRQVAPHARIVVDFDDLMSRRYDFVGRQRLPLSLGYLERFLPGMIARLAVGRLARLVVWYERRALKEAESEALRLADAVVLLNREEADTLAKTAFRDPTPRRARIIAIPPPAEVRVERLAVCPSLAPQAWRAVFVGSDILVQNRLTIAYLLDLWSTFGVRTELWVYGRQKHPWHAVPNVHFAGYVEDIADAYAPGSFMVYPCLVPGGIKTKVLEAFGHGVPVVGNRATFEGILPRGYPLIVENVTELVELLKEPCRRALDFAGASAVASEYLQQEHNLGTFVERWRRAMLGGV